MTEDADSYSQAEIVRLLKRLDLNVGNLASDLKRLEQNYVTRAEWTLWKEANNREMKQLKEEVEGVKDSTAPVKVSGWTIAAFALSAVVGLGSLLGLAITLMTVVK